MSQFLTVSQSPHLRHEDSTSTIMADVIIALCPAAIFGCVIFGFRALALLLTTVASSVLCEFLWNKALKKPQTIRDFSAIVTGLLLGMNLSPKTPFWVAVLGSVIAIIIVKQMFGGLGYNFANPAIAARIILMVSFPQFLGTMSRFVEPLSHEPVVDTITGATPLTAVSTGGSMPDINSLFFGMHSGCIGETSAFLLLIGGIYLILRRVINPIIPVSFIGFVALFSALSGLNVFESILSGGLMLGAIFMATDYTTSPTSNWGKLIFGFGCGAITFVIRRFASLPEGVSYSILIMNILVPHIDSLTLKVKAKKEVAAE